MARATAAEAGVGEKSVTKMILTFWMFIVRNRKEKYTRSNVRAVISIRYADKAMTIADIDVVFLPWYVVLLWFRRMFLAHLCLCTFNDHDALDARLVRCSH